MQIPVMGKMDIHHLNQEVGKTKKRSDNQMHLNGIDDLSKIDDQLERFMEDVDSLRGRIQAVILFLTQQNEAFNEALEEKDSLEAVAVKLKICQRILRVNNEIETFNRLISDLTDRRDELRSAVKLLSAHVVN